MASAVGVLVPIHTEGGYEAGPQAADLHKEGCSTMTTTDSAQSTIYDSNGDELMASEQFPDRVSLLPPRPTDLSSPPSRFKSSVGRHLHLDSTLNFS